MKKFNDFNSAFNWVGKITKDTSKEVKEDIAKQVYQDSEKYTYIDTKKMYLSGSSSNFKEGKVTIKAPQVRWLYYTRGINAGPGNRLAIPMWFEQVKKDNMSKYKEIYAKTFNERKKK